MSDLLPWNPGVTTTDPRTFRPVSRGAKIVPPPKPGSACTGTTVGVTVNGAWCAGAAGRAGWWTRAAAWAAVGTARAATRARAATAAERRRNAGVLRA